MIEIKNYWTGKVIVRDEGAESLRDAVVRRVANRGTLRGADLRGAVLRGADLSGADLSGALGLDENGQPKPLTDADYLEIRDRFRASHPDVPIVPLLDSTICKIVNSGEGKLNMGNWHDCETTHCRAGWAIHLAGEAGYALEEKYDSERAGGMIYRASTGRWPNFFASNESALKDICEWGAKEEELLSAPAL
jgi:hypothetical protein